MRFVSFVLVFLLNAALANSFFLLALRAAGLLVKPKPGPAGKPAVLSMLFFAAYIPFAFLGIWGGIVGAHLANGTGFFSHLGLCFVGFALCSLGMGNISASPGLVYDSRLSDDGDPVLRWDEQFITNIETGREALQGFLRFGNLCLLAYLVIFTILSLGSWAPVLPFVDVALAWTIENAWATLIAVGLGLWYARSLFHGYYPITKRLGS